MALYSKEQLAEERKLGLQMTDKENENFYKDEEEVIETTYKWTNAQFEAFLNEKTEWSENTKRLHRGYFKGEIIRKSNGKFNYPE